MGTELKVADRSFSKDSKFKLLFLSSIGIFMFFIPIELMGRKTILIDHFVNMVMKTLSTYTSYYTLGIIVLGTILPIYTGRWKKSIIDMIFTGFKFLGIVVSLMAISGKGPEALMRGDMIPFLFNKLAIPVGIMIPLGSIFLSFLVGYGLLEFIGVIMEPVMKPIWKTPGRSAVDAVASFVGSYSIGLLITNSVYKEGKYTVKEACIIATGFSTVSATFMIIVAKTLGLMEIWNFYFWSTLIITFLVTAISVRIYPLRSKPNVYHDGSEKIEDKKRDGNIFKNAYLDGLESASNSDPVITNIVKNMKDGMRMAAGVVPTILSIGLLGLILAEYTPIFDLIGYIFYPFTSLMKIPDPMIVSKAVSLEIAEMFLPALLVKGVGHIITRYVIGVVSISAILFFSALIPCILATEIPLKIREMVIIWIERTILTIVLAGAVAHIFL